MNEKRRVLVPLGDGFEELEALAVVDLLRRVGCQVITASVGSANPMVGRNRIRVMADLDMDEALAEWGEGWDLVVLPGGLGGTEAMEDHAGLMDLVRRRVDGGRLTAAICAAPRILARVGLARSVAITGHPGCRGDLDDFGDYREDAVVVDGAVITSRGPGTAVAFGLALVSALFGAERADALRAEIVA